MSDILDGEVKQGKDLVWGPWRIPGWFGIANNAFACIWMVIILFFTSWPSSTPVTPATMNYSIFITLFVAATSALYYIVWGRQIYTGPVVETAALDRVTRKALNRIK